MRVNAIDGRLAQKITQADLGAEPLRHPRDKDGRQQGVPSEVEEAVLNPDPTYSQHLSE
jgi:hypothetical protein